MVFIKQGVKAKKCLKWGHHGRNSQIMNGLHVDYFRSSHKEFHLSVPWFFYQSILGGNQNKEREETRMLSI